ncbi:hypothetical protein Dimus_028713, partial [Dionaea muscipula]
SEEVEMMAEQAKPGRRRAEWSMVVTSKATASAEWATRGERNQGASDGGRTGKCWWCRADDGRMGRRAGNGRMSRRAGDDGVVDQAGGRAGESGREQKVLLETDGGQGFLLGRTPTRPADQAAD